MSHAPRDNAIGLAFADAVAVRAHAQEDGIERFCMDPASEVPVDEWGWRQAPRRGEIVLQCGVRFSEPADPSAIAEWSASFPTSALLRRAGSPAGGPLRYGPPGPYGTAALVGGSSAATFLRSAVEPAQAPRAWM